MNGRDNILIETERLYIRSISESDIDCYCTIYTSVNGSEFGDLLNHPAYAETAKLTLWNELNQKNKFNALIFLQGTDALCGQICMQHTDTDAPEIGIDILPEYQNQGYGPEAITTFVRWYSEAYRIQKVKVCIEESNAHSRHVFEKLGAKYVGALPVFTEAYLDAVRHALPGSDITELEEAKVDTFFLSFGNSIS